MVDNRAETVRAAPTRRHPAKTTLWVLLFLTSAAGCADLAAREIARRPLFPAIDAATATLAVVIGALAGIAAGAAVSTDGTSFPYRQAVCVAGLFYGLVGPMLCYRLCSLFFTRGLAAAATALMATGSFLLWYLVKEPSMTHAPARVARRPQQAHYRVLPGASPRRRRRGR